MLEAQTGHNSKCYCSSDVFRRETIPTPYSITGVTTPCGVHHWQDYMLLLYFKVLAIDHRTHCLIPNTSRQKGSCSLQEEQKRLHRQCQQNIFASEDNSLHINTHERDQLWSGYCYFKTECISWKCAACRMSPERWEAQSSQTPCGSVQEGIFRIRNKVVVNVCDILGDFHCFVPHADQIPISAPFASFAIHLLLPCFSILSWYVICW